MDKDTCITNLRDLILPSNTDDENEALLFAIESVRARGNAQKVVVVPPEVITELSKAVVDVIAKINWSAAIELHYTRTRNGWIPVNERLPDLWEVVLVTDESDKVYEYERRPLDENGNKCEEWCFLGRKIIAWQPLPEPYKEGGTE